MKRTTALYTLFHFVVDFACFVVLFGFLPEPAQMVGFLAYNIVAFGLQTPLGIALDALLRPGKHFCALSFVLLLAGLALAGYAPFAGMFACALGNALFHVSAGRDVLILSRGKMGANGVFVASGALGVALGTLWGREARLLSLLLCVSCLGLTFLADSVRSRYASSAPLARGGVLLGAVLCFVCIFVRSLGGSLFVKPVQLTALALAACAAGGKALGGFLADRFGARRVAAGSLLLACVLLFLLPPHPIITCLGVLCFNMPMAVTLVYLADRLPGRPGFAFGLTTLALLVGALPIFFGLGAQPLLGLGLSILALAFLWILLPKEAFSHDKTVS